MQKNDHSTRLCARLPTVCHRGRARVHRLSHACNPPLQSCVQLDLVSDVMTAGCNACLTSYGLRLIDSVLAFASDAYQHRGCFYMFGAQHRCMHLTLESLEVGLC